MLIPLAILFALAAMGVFLASLVSALGERKGKKQGPLVPVVPAGAKPAPAPGGPAVALKPPLVSSADVSLAPPVSPAASIPAREPVNPVAWPTPQASQSKNEIAQLKEKLEISLKETERFSADNNRLRNEVVALTKSLAGLQAKASGVSSGPRDSMLELVQKLTAQEAVVGSLKEQLAAAQKELENVRTSRQAEQPDVEALKAKADTLAKQNEAYKAQESGQQQELEKLKNENTRLAKDFDELMKKAQESGRRSVPAQEDPAQAALIAQLKKELTGVRNELEDSKLNYQKLLAEFEASKKDSDSSVQENEAYKAEAAIQHEEIEALKSAQARLNEELNEKNKMIETMAQGTKPEQEDAQALQAKIEAYHKEIGKLNEVIAGLRQKEGLAGLISKEEYDEVKQQISQKESALLKLKTELENVLPQYQALQLDFAQEKKHEQELARALEDMTAQVEELKNQASNRFPAELAYLRKKLSLNEETSDKEVLVKAIESFEDSLVRGQALEKQLKSSAGSSQQQAPGGTVPEEEYMKIKQKLEAAEKILRLIHGAG